MWGIEFKKKDIAINVWKILLKKGFLTLLEGEEHNILTFVPSIYFSERKLEKVCKIIEKTL
jgi:4-aminobutyrate aminotransferase-like enzyme